VEEVVRPSFLTLQHRSYAWGASVLCCANWTYG